jgi:DNA-binding MarR family transcriptional regulator
MTPAENSWAFVTSHALVLLEVYRNPKITVRDIAEGAGLTERQVHRVLTDLVDAGYVVRTRNGRRNEYQVDEERPMRHPSIAHHRIDELLQALKT